MLITIFAVLSVATGLITFYPYTVNMIKGTARPHFFSWTTWGILTGLGFILSITNGGGAGSIIFGLQSVSCFVVAIYALFKGEKNITAGDWFSFISALVVTIIYVFTKNAAVSVVLAAVIDCLGFIPTFRKSYLKPREEPVATYLFSFLSFLFSIGALPTFSFVTLFYPAILVFSNLLMVLFLIIRRKAVKI